MTLPLKDSPEDSLSHYWLCVWRCLVERHWNLVRRDDEENDPYSRGRTFGKPHYTYESMRRDKCKSVDATDEDVADLARDYWKRNRFDIKEYFVNLTYNNWPDAEIFELYVAMTGNEWIDCCCLDHVYSDRRTKFDQFGGEYLFGMGWLQYNLKVAMKDAVQLQERLSIKKLREEQAIEATKKKQNRQQKIDTLKKKVKSFFNLKILER